MLNERILGNNLSSPSDPVLWEDWPVGVCSLSTAWGISLANGKANALIIALSAYLVASAAFFSMQASIVASMILRTASKIEVRHRSWDNNEMGVKGNLKWYTHYAVSEGIEDLWARKAQVDEGQDNTYSSSSGAVAGGVDGPEDMS